MKQLYPILIAEHLRVGYEGGPDVLNDFSLEIFPGEVIGVLGRNGSGKTTLVRALLGLLKLREGSIRYFTPEGKPCERIEIGYVPQQAKLDHQFPITVLEVVLSGLLKNNHLCPRKSHRLLALKALERVGIPHLKGRSIGMLSGGERQRVLLARALVSKPALLILDEPTTYMDEQFSEYLYGLIPELSKESAIVMVSHNSDRLSELASKIVRF